MKDRVKKTFEIDVSKTPLLNLKFSRWRSGLTIEQKRCDSRSFLAHIHSLFTSSIYLAFLLGLFNGRSGAS